MAGTWAAGTSMAYTHNIPGSLGASSTGAMCFCGYGTGASKTETLSGTTWTTRGDYNTTVAGTGGFGTVSASVGVSGYNQARCNNFNGTSWADAGANYYATTWNFGKAGTQSAGLIAGGATTGTTSRKFNGTTWSDGGNLATAAVDGTNGCGTQSSCIVFLGNYTPDANDYLKINTYNGTSWSNGTNISSKRMYPGMFGASASLALVVGGMTGASEQTDLIATTALWNGTSWAADGTMSQAIWQCGGFGDVTSGGRAGGRVYNDNKQNTVELYTGASAGMAGVKVAGKVAFASIKVVEKVAIASVKKLAGVA